MVARRACPAPEGGHVVPALDRLLAPRTERAAPGVDDLRVDRADVVDVDAELLPVPWQETGQEHVRAAREVEQHLAPFGYRHVQADAALAAVGVLDVRVGVALHPQQTGLAQSALRIAGDGVFDLDDVGAPLAEHRARRRHESVHRDLENPDSFERAAHDAAPGSPGTTVANVLRLQELLEAGPAHLPADARLLVAAERAVRAEVVAAVDRERPGADAPGHGQCPVLAAEDGARQSVDGVVGDPDRVVVVLVGDHGEHRPEHLLLGDLTVRVHVGEQRRAYRSSPGRPSRRR